LSGVKDDEVFVFFNKLGAAVIDDKLGLLILAFVSGIIVSGDVDLLHMALTFLIAMLFLGGAIFFGPYLLRFIIGLFRKDTTRRASAEVCASLSWSKAGMRPRPVRIRSRICSSVRSTCVSFISRPNLPPPCSP